MSERRTMEVMSGNSGVSALGDRSGSNPAPATYYLPKPVAFSMKTGVPPIRNIL